MKVRRYTSELDDTKKWFLEEMENNGYDYLTIKSYENFLYRIRDFEINYMNDKKINEFNYDEIILFLKILGSSSIDSLSNYVCMISIYFDFCKKESKMDNVIDYIRAISLETLEKCVNKDKFNNRFISRETLYTLVDKLINEYDKAILLLTFEGIMGKGYSELINLKVSDLDFECNIIKLSNREVAINDKLKFILKRLVHQDTIFYANEIDNRVNELNMDSPYLFKPTNRYISLKSTQKRIEQGKYNPYQIDSKVLNNRIFKILKEFIRAPYLTMNNIYRSGLIEQIKKNIGEENITKQTFADEITKISDYSLGTGYKIYQNYISSNVF